MAKEKLVILWSSGERDVALELVFKYAGNAPRNGWWDEVTLIVWGPSARLLVGDTELQEGISSLAGEGIKLEACKACSDGYGVSEQLAAMGVEVKYMGEVLTDYIKEGRRVLTF